MARAALPMVLFPGKRRRRAAAIRGTRTMEQFSRKETVVEGVPRSAVSSAARVRKKVVPITAPWKRTLPFTWRQCLCSTTSSTAKAMRKRRARRLKVSSSPSTNLLIRYEELRASTRTASSFSACCSLITHHSFS